LFLVTANVFGQHPSYVHLTEKDGLPDIEFYDILEDGEGFVWLAADKGLYRYDGKSFKNYSHPDKRGLSVFGLRIGPNGRIWCNNISGQYFYVENDELILFKDIKEITKGQLAEFTFYEKSLILHAYPKILSVNIETKEIISDFDNVIVYAFSNLVKDKLIIITKKHIISFNNFGVEKHRIIHGLNLDHNRTFFFNHKEHLFFNSYSNTTSENKIFEIKNGKLKELQVPEKLIGNKIIRCYNLDGLLWACTDEGVFVYDFLNDNFKLKAAYFEGKKITKVIKDFKDNYWFTSLREGVFVIPNIHIKQHNLPNEILNVTCMDKLDSNTLILGSTTGHLSFLKRDSKEIDVIKLNSRKKMFSICNNIYSDEVYASLGDASIIYNKKGKSITESKKLINAKEISLIDKNKFLFSAYSSAFILDKNKKEHKNLGTRRSYTSFYSRKFKNTYVAYVDDLEMYDEKLASKKIRFNNKPIFAIDIDETDDGVIWVSTFKDGLIGIKDGNVIANFTMENGLLSNQTTTIRSDGNLLWVTTDKGVQLFDTKNNTFKSLTKKDGISSFNITDIVVFDKEVVFSSNKGVFSVNKNRVFKDNSLSEIYFTNVYIEDEIVELSDKYVLNPNENKIQFSFHINGYNSEENIIYKYRLLGTNDTWSSLASGVSEVTFNSLSAGNYEFQLKGVEKNDLKETEVQSIQIKISLPVYKKWWFIAICVLLGGVLIIGYYKNKLRIKENEKQLQLEKAAKDSELVFLKLENLRSQMNPHFIFNALNSIQDYILLNQKNLAGDYLGKFADLIRMYLNHSTKGSIPLSEEIEALNQYLELEKLRFEDTLHYQIKVTNEIVRDTIEIPTMLIQPYIENAIKHGLLHKKNDRQLNISFSLIAEEENLLCEVTDNGVGRKRASELKAKRGVLHQSFAGKATNDRLELLNYGKEHKTSVVINDLYSKEDVPLGTQVLISIPYTKI